MQDVSLTDRDEDAYQQVADEFRISLDEVDAVAGEGTLRDWPIPPA